MAGCASRWPSGTSTIRSSRSARSACPAPRATTARTSRSSTGSSTRRPATAISRPPTPIPRPPSPMPTWWPRTPAGRGPMTSTSWSTRACLPTALVRRRGRVRQGEPGRHPGPAAGHEPRAGGGADPAPAHALVPEHWSWGRGGQRPRLRPDRATDGTGGQPDRGLIDRPSLARTTGSAGSGSTSTARASCCSPRTSRTPSGCGARPIRSRTSRTPSIGPSSTASLRPANPEQTGSKAASRHRLVIAAGRHRDAPLAPPARLGGAAPSRLAPDPFDGFEADLRRPDRRSRRVLRRRSAGDDLTADERLVQRQAFAGLIWCKQFYHYDVDEWLDGDPALAASASHPGGSGATPSGAS